MEALKLIELCRELALTLSPFWGAHAFGFMWVARLMPFVMATDGKSIYYNPALVEARSKVEIVFIILHEVAHVLLLHPWRQGSRNHELWNIACDHEVNWILRKSGLALPSGLLCDSRFIDLSAEDIYNVLLKEQKQEDDQEGDQGDNSDQEGQEGQEGNQEQEGDQEGDQEGQEGDQKGDQEGQEGDQGQDLEPWQWGGTLEPSDDPEESQQAKDRAITNMDQAIRVGAKAGCLPAPVKEAVERRYAPPALDWQQIQNCWFAERLSNRDDYDATIPSRRHLACGLIMPSLYSPECSVVYATDCSGSVETKNFENSISEVHNALSGTNLKLYYLAFSHLIVDEKVLEPGVIPDIERLDHGGTDYRPIWTWIDQHPECEAKIVVVYTDGQCNSFPEYVTQDVLWIVAGAYRNRSFKPPFGEVIQIEE